MQAYRYGALILLVSLLSACGPRAAMMTAGTLGGMGAMQERGLGGAISDYQLKLTINEAWFHRSLVIYENADLMISEGRVLLIGQVPDEITRLEAALIAQDCGAREVVNRLTIGPGISFGQSLTDRWISTRLTGELTFDRDVSALNYDVEVVGGVVYLMGIARSEGEVRRVTYLASQIDGVSKVESHMRVKSAIAFPHSPEGN